MELPASQLACARRGDRDALGALVRHYQDRVYAVCVACAGPDAEDCAQDALVKVLAAVHRFDPAGSASLGGWILAITRRVCIDRARSARVVRHRELEIDGLATVDRADAAATCRERGEQVRSAVLALPDDQRAAITMREWGELDYEEIASIEGVPIGTVRSRIARARDALRAALSPLFDESEVRDVGR
ncbi:MAG: sigma-70 family RNA polymerase sigma factor [Kofleriaceae bacterium]